VSVQQILAGLDASALSPVYLFCPGKAPRGRTATFEPLIAGRAVEAITDAAVDPANRDMAYAAYYADETSPGEVVMDAQTLPFLAERRVIVVRNAERYNSESGAGALLSYLASPNESTVLLMVANKVDKRTKFYKACQESGEVVECPALVHGEVLQWVREEARGRGVRLDGDAAAAMVDRTGTHLSDVENALTNVINFVGEACEVVSEADVIAACADVAEEEIWALTDAIAASQPGDAIAAFRRLSDLGKHPDEIIGTINWLLKSAYAIATAEGEPPISRFVARKVEPLSRKLGVTKLRAAFALCTDTQFMSRNTGVDGALALELLVVKLATPVARRKSA